MKAADKGSESIPAAGGIVVRPGAEPRIAIVRLRKDNAWVLPKGKLKTGEETLAAAKREVREETGHDVSVHEFLGAMCYLAGNKPKVVQFWRMQPLDGRRRKLMRDVKAVQWLPLNEAINTLTHVYERNFLSRVGPGALQATARPTLVERIRAWFRRLMQRP